MFSLFPKKSVFDLTFPTPEYIITVTVSTQRNIFFTYWWNVCQLSIWERAHRQTDRLSLDWARGERDDAWWGFSETTWKVIG